MPVSLIKARTTVSLHKIVNRAYACTCHIPDSSRFGRFDVGARAIVLRHGMDEWEHLDDGTAASTHHAHIERASSDCDGPHEFNYVRLPNPGEEASWEFSQWMRVAEMTVSPASPCGTLTTSKDDNGRMTAVWSAPTEEGYEYELARMCIDPHCAYERASQRDYFAEAMGY